MENTTRRNNLNEDIFWSDIFQTNIAMWYACDGHGKHHDITVYCEQRVDDDPTSWSLGEKQYGDILVWLYGEASFDEQGVEEVDYMVAYQYLYKRLMAKYSVRYGAAGLPANIHTRVDAEVKVLIAAAHTKRVDVRTLLNKHSRTRRLKRKEI